MTRSISSTPVLVANVWIVTFSVTLTLLLAGSILLLASFIWLRSGFGILKSVSKTFSTPYTGTPVLAGYPQRSGDGQEPGPRAIL